MNNKFFCISLMLGLMVCANAQNVITVDASGNGDYTTVQAAVDAVTEGAEATIYVKAGTYEEMVKVGTRQKPSTKKISLIGEGMDKTIITAANGKNTIGSGKDVRDYATLAVFAPDFYAEGLCIQNTGGKAAGQALALHVDGDRQTYYRCKIAGYQDTHRTKKETRSYYKECVIEGAVDYIYAGGTCWFERCTLNSVASGYITAPEDITVYTTAEDGTKIWLGFIFNECTVTKASGVSDNSVSLGRCWGAEKCGSLFMNCQLNNVIKQAGWETMGGNDGTMSYFAEYKNKNGSALADISSRISWSHQLSDADYEKLNTWKKVDALYRTIKTTAVAFDPEAVITSHMTTDDYAPLENKLLAFPTARGFGKYVTGGRGCKVVEVTNLEDNPSNPSEGSLRWALTVAGKENTTIVFRVGGIITLKSDIRAKLTNVTIAGQTAPGDGILIRGAKMNFGGGNNFIIRNIRARLGKTDDNKFIQGGSIGIENANNFIIDHCCFGWSGEENTTIYDNHFSTVQWCIVHEGLYNAGHPKGARGYGCQWGGSPATYHHNLLAHNDSRSCRVNGASNPSQDRCVFLEYINNVNYNWGRQNSCYGGENEAGTGSAHYCNFIGNYYKPGPARTNSSYFIELSAARSGKTILTPSKWYFSGNKMVGFDNATNDNWSAVNNKAPFSKEEQRSETLLYPEYFYPTSMAFDYDEYKTPFESADDAYEHVLAKVGTVNRDKVEQRLIMETREGKATYKGASANKGGIIDSPADCEGYYPYDGGTAPADTDHDGMPDEWETANGFNPNDASDGAKVASAEGYTALEIYLNSLMGERIPINTTGIQQIATIFGNNQPVGWYTLQGIQLAQKPSAPGLYVSNGRKFFVK